MWFSFIGILCFYLGITSLRLRWPITTQPLLRATIRPLLITQQLLHTSHRYLPTPRLTVFTKSPSTTSRPTLIILQWITTLMKNLVTTAPVLLLQLLCRLTRHQQLLPFTMWNWRVAIQLHQSVTSPKPLNITYVKVYIKIISCSISHN